jgi:hypothetical protein
VEACVRELAARRVPLAALWSDRHDFYGRLGFLPGGCEHLFVLDAGLCRRARGDAPCLPAGPVRAEELEALEALYVTQPVHAVRERGALAALAAAPETRLWVARREGTPVAYAALGRGDDFAGVVHEWAGSPDGVLSCLEALCAGSGRIGWLAGPAGGACAAALRAAGAPVHEGCFALLRILDAAGLVRAVAPDGTDALGLEAGPDDRLALAAAGGPVPLAPAEALAWLFGDGPPEGVERGLDPRAAGRLREALPFPLYLWGFDSI